MKSYTDLEQSKKLAEILPLESADMRYHTISQYNPHPCDEIVYTIDFGKPSGIDIPAWSLSALLKLMPKIGANEPKLCKRYYIYAPLIRYVCIYGLLKDTKEYDNPVDACYEIIVWLKEINKL